MPKSSADFTPEWPFEPFRIKVIEPIGYCTKKERIRLLKEAGYNIFSIPSEKIFIDLLTDSGTSAMSDNQWAGLMMGDESYAGARNYYHLVEVLQHITGFKHIIPTHQGRSAENIIFSSLTKPCDIIPSNMHFDTTSANIKRKGCLPVNLIIDQAYDCDLDYPFKGNMDLDKLHKLIREKGNQNIPLCMMTITNNSGGGQPVSLANIREVKQLLDKYGIPLLLDACRFSENAFFIKHREAGYEKKSVAEIAKEVFSYADGCFVSAKKDGLVNIGGFIACNSDQWAQKFKEIMVVIEGFPTYGGLAGRDLEAMARGLQEGLNEAYLAYRIGQVRRFGEKIEEQGVKVLKPYGGHAIYVDAKAALLHIPQKQLPGQALVVELYRSFGVRSVEIGTIMFGDVDLQTGEVLSSPKLELVRLAIPRRVYTDNHLIYVAEALGQIAANSSKIEGFRFVPPIPQRLKHFLAIFEPIV